MIAPLLEALIAYLKTDSSLSTLVGTRIFGLELPKEEVSEMPRKSIVLSLTPVIGLTDNTDIEHETIGLDAFSYGETPIEALKTQRALHIAMKTIRNVEQNSVLIHWATRRIGPRSFQDPDLRSPVVIETFAIFGSDYTT